MDDVRQRLAKVVVRESDDILDAERMVELCRDALREIERLEKTQMKVAMLRIPPAPPIFGYADLPFGEANGAGGALTKGQRIQRLERWVTEFITSNCL